MILRFVPPLAKRKDEARIVYGRQEQLCPLKMKPEEREKKEEIQSLQWSNCCDYRATVGASHPAA